ncbi:MAG TPA: DNA cytosine methyltransferase [Streptosporangiaceae bacterium]|jgi:DNA (cytosine-5)-methyltransferase 1
MTWTLIDFFCGAGGSSQGGAAVPGVTVRLAANHWDTAIASHTVNFPAAEHFQGDLHDADLDRFPAADLFWASPECPTWSQARGRRRDFDKQPDLFGETLPDEATDRSRSLMWDVPRYLAAMARRGRPVLAGVVENVTDVRAWTAWHTWVGSIANLGYRTKLIALNSMHARPATTPYAPQSRDRLYLAYWLASLGRDPDWDRWLRPQAWCPGCAQHVRAVQWWKRPGNDMGRYRQQYLYRCPQIACRGQVIEPGAMPAAAAIDWTLPGTRIGDRATPLKPKTLARIEAGLRRYARPLTQTATPTLPPPLMIPAGGTWRQEATPVTGPMGARTTRENDGLATPPFLTVHRGGPGDVRTAAVTGAAPAVTASGNHLGVAVPPLLVPVEGRDGKEALPADAPARTQTARAETSLAVPPFLAVLRGNCDATAITAPLGAVTTSGLNHALISPADAAMVMRNNTPRGDPGQMCTPALEPLRALTAAGHQSLLTWEHLAHLLIPYNRTGVVREAAEPIGSLTTRDRFALASPAIDVADVLFRMLEPHEISAAMAFQPGYTVLGSKREKVRQLGNAVTPPVAEVLFSALIEAIQPGTLPAAA